MLRIYLNIVFMRDYTCLYTAEYTCLSAVILVCIFAYLVPFAYLVLDIILDYFGSYVYFIVRRILLEAVYIYIFTYFVCLHLYIYLRSCLFICAVGYIYI